MLETIVPLAGLHCWQSVFHSKLCRDYEARHFRLEGFEPGNKRVNHGYFYSCLAPTDSTPFRIHTVATALLCSCLTDERHIYQKERRWP